MRLPIFTMFLIILFSVGLDYYIWQTIKRIFPKHKGWSKLYAASSVALTLFILVTISLPRNSGSDLMLVTIMWMLYAYFSIYIPKLLFCIVSWLFLPFRNRKQHLWSAANICGTTIAIIVFATMWWGAAVNRLCCKVTDVEIVYPNLPESFNGYRIVQFSDLHTGSYGNDTSYIAKVVAEINRLNPDLVVFTGDIVNRRSDELKPFVKVLAGIKARDGVIPILGNHDYGDYSKWPDDSAKQANMTDLVLMQKAMNWRLLRNECVWLRKGSDSIAIIGVENWGEPPFKTYGDLKGSYPTLSDSNFKVLLSHNPVHWEREIMNNDSVDIALTLSGHTHAMQIEIGPWSPSSWRYDRWGGLYDAPDNKNKHLYVNIGLGTVGIPARIGATPELTLITLLK